MASNENIYQTLKAVFDSAARRIFNFLFGVWKRTQTQSCVSHTILQKNVSSDPKKSIIYYSNKLP